MIAPLIPGLTDHELPQIMQAVKEAGAKGVGYVMLGCRGPSRRSSSTG